MSYEERPTQEDRILQLLEKNSNTRVSSLDIVLQLYILQYTARIWGLRKKGHKILNKQEYKKNSFGDTVKIGYYMLSK